MCQQQRRLFSEDCAVGLRKLAQRLSKSAQDRQQKTYCNQPLGPHRCQRADASMPEDFLSASICLPPRLHAGSGADPGHGSYSQRNATIGSTFAARRAGKKQASKATAISNNVTPPKVWLSSAVTS